MSELSNDVAADGYAHGGVPDAAMVSAWRVFFIVVGSLCGLPVFVMSAQLGAALGPRDALWAFLAGGAISGLLGGLSAWAGAATRLNLALLSERAFGHQGAALVKLVIALSLVGWFGVIINVLGAAASKAMAQTLGITLAPEWIALSASIAVALIAWRGIGGLERVGMVIAPLTAVLLVYALLKTIGDFRFDAVPQPVAGVGFGAAVSAVVGSYIVGIVIQPDYGRFVRRPLSAAAACGVVLGVLYPLVLVASAIPALARGEADLIGAMIALGVGVPALVLLLMGCWIDASACLYSACLSLTNQIPGVRMRSVIAAVAVVGAVLALLQADRYFLPFLTTLGFAFPPIAVVQIIAVAGGRHTATPVRLRGGACLAWLAGSATGFASASYGWTLTGVSTLDAILVSTVIAITAQWLERRRMTPGAIATLHKS
jgi:cytosine permease